MAGAGDLFPVWALYLSTIEIVKKKWWQSLSGRRMG
jgi:hypothetical protein